MVTDIGRYLYVILYQFEYKYSCKTIFVDMHMSLISGMALKEIVFHNVLIDIPLEKRSENDTFITDKIYNINRLNII